MKKTLIISIFGIAVSSISYAESVLPQHFALEHAFECGNINYKQFDAALKMNKVPTDGPDFDLPYPILVFGLPVTKISVFRQGGEDGYRAYLPGKPLKDVIKASNLKLVNNAYERRTKAGILSIEPYGAGGASLKCTINFE